MKEAIGRAVVLLAFVVLSLPTPARSQVLAWDYFGNGNWETTSNWQELLFDVNADPNDPNFDPNVYWGGHSDPSTNLSAYVRNNSTVTIGNTTGIGLANGLSVGGGAYNYDLGVSADIRYNPGGHLVVTGGSLYTAGNVVVGEVYDGTAVQTGGTISAYSLYVGYGMSTPTVYGQDPNKYFHQVNGVYTMTGGSVCVYGRYTPFGDRGCRGTLNISGDARISSYGGNSINFGERGVIDPISGNWIPSVGVLNMDGGTLGYYSANTRSMGIGGAADRSDRCGCIGIANITDGLIELVGNRTDLMIGRRGYLLPDGSADPNFPSSGTVNMSGGSIVAHSLVVGRNHATGVVNLSGGTIAVAELVYGSVIGDGTVENVGGFRGAATAYGTVNMSGGVYGLQAGALGTTTMYIGRGVYEPVDEFMGYPEARSPGVGVFNLSGGSAHFSAVTLGLGANSNSVGKLSVTGGSLTVGGSLIMAGANQVSAFMTVGKNATVRVGQLSMNDDPGNSRISKLTVDLDKGGVGGKITVSDTALLDGTLRLDVLSRPREGDTLKVVTSGVGITDSGIVLNYDPVIGLKKDPNDPNTTLPAFAGGIDGTGLIYRVIFQALTAGDADGNSRVDGGDLALMGGGWMKTGQTWSTGDFDGSGKVDGSDLALMGGNWMWTKPSPGPEAAVPEPTTLAVLGFGGLALIRKKRAGASR